MLTRSGGQYVAKAGPMIESVGTGPQNLLSSDSPRLSPIMNQCPGGILIVLGNVQAAPLSSAQVSLMNGSFAGLPLRITRPLMIETVSPGPATILLMKFTFDSWGVGLLQAAPCSGLSPH